MENSSTPKLSACILFVLSAILGPGTVVALFLFLYAGSPNLVNLKLSEPALLCVDALLCFAFFIQHSSMIRKSFRRWVTRLLPAHYDNAFFAIASGIVLLVLLLLWQESTHTLLSFQNSGWWFFRALFFLSLSGFAWCFWALGFLDPFGLKPFLNHLRGIPRKPPSFIIRGPYRWVRHPVYFFQIVIIWSTPHLTSDRFLFNVLWSTWIVIATVFEERDLRTSFGDAYTEYQSKVPMLIPCRLRPIR
ncbi:MAG: isoprenylcysteine carboxylmethyltransferase family protein [Proteobacteria bacterium]|nr:isoprenylcysteine carboxylmethyltransferase family protein [Pseudomonadota bacterium]